MSAEERPGIDRPARPGETIDLTSSDEGTFSIELAPVLREWCCGTPISSPHEPGCSFEPRPDNPIDYGGPAIMIPPTNPGAAS